LSTMADFTCSKSHLDCLEEAITKLTANQLSLTATQNSMTLKIDELLQKIATLESHPPSPTSSITPPCVPSPLLNPPRLKLEVYRFDDTDPLGRIFKITQFFEYHSTPELERLTIASFYMGGSALAWFQWMSCNGQLVSRHRFCRHWRPFCTNSV